MKPEIIAGIIANVKKDTIDTIFGRNMKSRVIKNETTNRSFNPTITRMPANVQYPYITQDPVALLKVWFTGF